MNFNEYQKEAHKTAVYPEYLGFVYLPLGLAAEAGEVAGKISKIVRGDGKIEEKKKEEIAQELGDTLWFIAETASLLGFTLDEVAQMNIKKLKDRHERNVIKGDGDNR